MKRIYFILAWTLAISCNQAQNSTKNPTEVNKAEAETDPYEKYNLPSQEIGPLFEQEINQEIIDIYLVLKTSEEGKKSAQLENSKGEKIAFTSEAIGDLKTGIGKTNYCVKIYADKSLPFGVIRYLHNLLKDQNLLTVAYVNASGKFYLDRLTQAYWTTKSSGPGPPPPPPPPPPSGDNPKKVDTYSKEAIQLLEDYGIEVSRNPTFMRGTFPKTKRRVLEVDLKGGESEEDLESALIKFAGEVDPQRRIISFISADNVSYDQYFSTHLILREFYYEARNEASRKEFGVDYLDAKQIDQRKIRQDYPILLSKGY